MLYLLSYTLNVAWSSRSVVLYVLSKDLSRYIAAMVTEIALLPHMTALAGTLSLTRRTRRLISNLV